MVPLHRDNTTSAGLARAWTTDSVDSKLLCRTYGEGFCIPTNNRGRSQHQMIKRSISIQLQYNESHRLLMSYGYLQARWRRVLVDLTQRRHRQQPAMSKLKSQCFSAPPCAYSPSLQMHAKDQMAGNTGSSQRMHFQWQDLGALQLLSVHAATTTHQGLPFEVEVCHELRSDMNRSAMDGFRRSAQWTATDWTFKPQT
jgi:hypothetical protein